MAQIVNFFTTRGRGQDLDSLEAHLACFVDDPDENFPTPHPELADTVPHSRFAALQAKNLVSKCFLKSSMIYFYRP